MRTLSFGHYWLQCYTHILIGLIWLAAIVSASTQSYNFTTVAGAAGQRSYTDDTNSAARFNDPAGLVVDPSGVIYVGDNAKIRQITRSGPDWVVTTLPVSFVFGVGPLALDSSGALYVADAYNNQICKLTPAAGTWTSKVIAGGGGNHLVDGTNTASSFNWPVGVAVDAQGTVYVADMFNNAIRKITPIGNDWVTTTIAGDITGSWGRNDGTNRAATFDSPLSLALDPAGNLYVTDTANFEIRRIAHVGTNWVTTTIAGDYLFTECRDGTNRAAHFWNPRGIAIDPAGTIYVADTGGQTIRKIVQVGTNWVTTTIGGKSGQAGSVDGVGANARFGNPEGIAIDAAGNVLIADSGGRTIRFGVPGFLLQAATCQNQLVLSWPSAATNYVLETSDSLSADALWRQITDGIALAGATFVITNSSTSPVTYFRLHK